MAEIRTERALSDPAIAFDHSGEGELLILMHGIGGNRTNWTRQVEAFSSRYHVVAWDARGYGKSDDYDGPLDFHSFACDLRDLLDHFGVEKAHICGLSMGGRIAQDFYLHFPERVKTLGLFATFSGFKRLNKEEQERFVRLRLKPLVEDGKEPKDIAPVVAKTLIGPDADPKHFQQLVESMEALHKESYVKTIQATTQYEKALQLEDINVPTLLIFGENDSLTPPAIGERMETRIADCEYVEVPRSGHLINIEEADIFNETLMSFLERRG